MKKIIGLLFAALSFTAFAAGIDPEASLLLDKMEKTYDPLDKSKTVKTKTVEIEMAMEAQDMKMNLTQYFKIPLMLKVKIEIPGIMETETGFDGVKAWDFSKAGGVRELTGKELSSMKFGAVMESPSMKLQNICSEIKLDKNGGDVDGVPCVKMVCTPKPEYNAPAFTVWVSPKDCLLRKMEMISVTQMGEIPSTTIFRNFKKCWDILIPYEQEITQLNMKMKTTVKSVEFNKEISDDEFKMPAPAAAWSPNAKKE